MHSTYIRTYVHKNTTLQCAHLGVFFRTQQCTYFSTVCLISDLDNAEAFEDATIQSVSSMGGLRAAKGAVDALNLEREICFSLDLRLLGVKTIMFPC